MHWENHRAASHRLRWRDILSRLPPSLRELVGPHKAPYLGPAHLLVMPVEVAGHPRIQLLDLYKFFDPNERGGFVQFEKTASLGRYQPEVTIGPIVQYASCPLPIAQFPN